MEQSDFNDKKEYISVGIETIEDRRIELLDRGSWKHSWHLPKTQYGYIDWLAEKTHEKLLEQVRDARTQSAYLTRLANDVEKILNK